MIGEPEKRHEDLLGGIRGLYNSETHSDLTITCGDDVYKAHKMVVCSQSKFFDAACRFPGKEAEEKCIDLPDDDPSMVQRMMYYFYHLDYLPTTAMDMCKLSGVNPEGGNYCPCVSTTVETCDGEETNECLITHAYMYAMGDKFRSQGLRDMASAKFKAALDDHGTPTGLSVVIPVICATTPDSDSVLRMLVAGEIVNYLCFLEDKDLQIVLRKFPVMAYYVLRAEHPQLLLPLPET